jgi:hypothetical protein
LAPPPFLKINLLSDLPQADIHLLSSTVLS